MVKLLLLYGYLQMLGHSHTFFSTLQHITTDESVFDGTLSICIPAANIMYPSMEKGWFMHTDLSLYCLKGYKNHRADMFLFMSSYIISHNSVFFHGHKFTLSATVHQMHSNNKVVRNEVLQRNCVTNKISDRMLFNRLIQQLFIKCRIIKAREIRHYNVSAKQNVY